MTPGKAASQAGHAFKLLTKNVLENNSHLAEQYFADGVGTNVVLKSKNLMQMERALYQAKEAGLPCVLIEDEHHIMPPHFDGSPIVTALGIGPVTREQVHHITKKFNLLQ